MKEKTIWKEGLTKKDYPKLSGTIETDVVIVGAGMAGIISAYLLTKAGKRVVVLEKKKIGAGATHYTTAFLTKSIDTDLSDLIKIYGEGTTKQILESHQDAISLIQKIAEEEKIDCDFTWCSNFIFANREKDLETLKEEYELMKKLGVDASVEPEGQKLGFSNFGSIEIHQQAKFQPMKFLYALAEKTEKLGAKIFEGTTVKDIQAERNQATVVTDKVKVTARYAIVATYEPFNKPLKLYFKKAFYTSYVMVADIEAGRLKEGTYEDTDNPYHYFRIEKGNRTDQIIIGGEDHRSDIHVDEAKNFKALKEYTEHLLKDVPHTLFAKWSGPILEPVDGLAYIGPLDHDNVLYAMAFSGNGMTYSAISAMIFRDYILGKNNPYADIYKARRIPTFKSLLTKGKDYTQELYRGAVKNTFEQ